ncbi:hypothetical protein EDB85DRAFT_1897194 [Lactarius pseudohatsudake]|nr:hypothetical protein EDB85DRAFT_1897194 [Lactarius pseudohatsudake]
MPIPPPETPGPIEVTSDETLHFDFPGSDIVLRSYDSHDFRVLKLYIVICSPVLQELIKSISNTSDVLPVVELPEIAPVLPSTPEKIMELLAVAQKYQMDSDPPFLRPETALHIYFLAQQHELRQEAVQAARVTLRLSMTIEDLEDKLEFPGMTGAYLHELWKYHQQVRVYLRSGVLEFRNSGLPHDIQVLRCGNNSPQWLYDYIRSVAEAPHLFGLTEFEHARGLHIGSKIYAYHYQSCSCVDMPGQVIRTFWEALTAVVHRAIEKIPTQADSALTLVKEEPTSGNSDPPSVPLCLDIPDPNIIVQSSDKVDFPVHKTLLAMSSPFFKDLLSLPQPPDDELVDGLPVIQLSEDADLLNSLISLLYPIAPVIPDSYEKVFALLAACQKYDMELIQSNIRAGIKHGTFPAPVEAEAFRACAIAGSMRLVPELENAARLTLGLPMTFESLGEQLRLFKGRALCDLVRRRRLEGAKPTRSNPVWYLTTTIID